MSEDPKDKDKAVQTGDNSVSPIIPLAGLALAAGAAVTVLRKKETDQNKGKECFDLKNKN